VTTLSIHTPTKGCINSCKFCCSKQHDEFPFPTYNGGTFNDDFNTILTEKLLYARQRGIQTLIFTGDGEPVSNLPYVYKVLQLNDTLGNDRFVDTEIQTTGVTLNDFILDEMWIRGIRSISLSVSDIFSDGMNMHIQNTPEKLHYKLRPLCESVREHGFTLRISLNFLGLHDPQHIIEGLSYYKPDRVTIRGLYADGDSPEAEWVRENRGDTSSIRSLLDECGGVIRELPNGNKIYSLNGVSFLVDDDCMGKMGDRYLILRPNLKLYSKWDDKASLVY
jgi:hypothetical protein